MDEFTWKFKVTLSDLPPGGAEFELVPDEAVREMLAQRAGVLAVPRLVARLHVRPEGKSGAAVDGTLEATVRQICVVSLEPFDNQIEEPIRFASLLPKALDTDAPQVIEVGGEDPPEPLLDGKLDLAEVVAEFLTLSVDPYPRRPGVEFVAAGRGRWREEIVGLSALRN
jgi:uncharacterized metal-binding protein YceD (DUF177 family)